MCGIFGYLNFKYNKSRKEIISILINGLKRLEYRGYDSAGLAFDSEDLSDGYRQIRIFKQSGRVRDLEKMIQDSKIDMDIVHSCHFGLAHTRWATHGIPNEINSHPQSSSDQNEFIVVHNGIITNHKDLQKFLINQGYTQKSQTDTEIIVILMKYFYDKHKNDQKLNFVELTKMVLDLIDGAFALLFKSIYFPNEVIAAKKSSPMIIGLKYNQPSEHFHIPIITNSGIRENGYTRTQLSEIYPEYVFDPTKGAEYFFASDASAIIEHTKRVIYLEDGDLAHVYQGHLYIHRSNSESELESVLFEEAKTLQLQLQEIMKGSFDTYMEKEIFEQPESIVNTMRGRVDFINKTVKIGGLQSQINHINRCRRIIFIACGTSYYSCVAVRQLMEELTEIPIMIELSSDLVDREMPVFRDDACVFVSQSGETADTLSALNYCKKFGALLMGITNVVGSTISRSTDCGIHLNAGPEIGVASTKAYTSQIIAICLFACKLAEDKSSKRSRIIEIIESLEKLPEIIRDCLKLSSTIEAVAKKYHNAKSCLVVGRGNHIATCFEGALKVKEVSYIHSEGILSGELKHGPLALVDENMLIIIIVTDCRIFSKSMNGLQQILARKAFPLVITDCLEKIGNSEKFDFLEIPHVIDCLQVIPAVIPLQLLSLHLAKMRGFDVDCPRNLAKSVTVE